MCFLCVCVTGKGNCRIRRDLIAQALSHCYDKASAITCNNSYNCLSNYSFSTSSATFLVQQRMCHKHALTRQCSGPAASGISTAPGLPQSAAFMNWDAVLNSDLLLSTLPSRHKQELGDLVGREKTPQRIKNKPNHRAGTQTNLILTQEPRVLQ